jgi:hypothetical protein
MSQTLAMVAAWGAEPPYERGLWDWANPNSSKIGVSLQTSTESGARGPFATGVRRPALNARDRRLRRRPDAAAPDASPPRLLISLMLSNAFDALLTSSLSSLSASLITLI